MSTVYDGPTASSLSALADASDEARAERRAWVERRMQRFQRGLFKRSLP
jgi:hypothetical protein